MQLRAPLLAVSLAGLLACTVYVDGERSNEGSSSSSSGSSGNGSSNGGSGGSGSTSSGEPSSSSGTSGSTLTEFEQDILARLNELRQDPTLSPRPEPALPILTWSEESAAATRAYVEACGGEGNNMIWGGGSPTITAQRIAEQIATGRQHFTFPSSCPSNGYEGATCQMWRILINRQHTSVGCAVTNCGEEDRWACRIGTGSLPSGDPY